jgi:hypothetical protein
VVFVCGTKEVNNGSRCVPSIFCERTAEYALIPALQRRLQEYYQWAIPMYFWGNREGTKTARQANHALQGRLLAVFARRAKTVELSGAIGGKINAELFQYHHVARLHGIYSIAAFAAVGTLEDLYRDPYVLWLSLEQERGDEGPGDVRFNVQISCDKDVPRLHGTPKVCSLSVAEIVNGIETHCRDFSYSGAMDAIAEVRSAHHNRSYGYFNFLGGYKPVFIFLPVVKSGDCLKTVSR